MKTTAQLQKQIMRRVYYTYGIRLATHPLMIHGVVLFVAILLLTRLVHVAAIVQNIANVKVGEMMSYVVGMFFHAEVGVLLLLGVCFFSCISLWGKVPAPRLHRAQAA